MQVTLTVNGRPRSGDVEPRTLLVDFLRDSLDLTGTKIGCDTGSCGSCNVLLDGRSVKSCSVLAVQADGREVTTIEGLSTHGQLTPIQQAFQDLHGVQCGFCTPGMVVTVTELLRVNPRPDEKEIRSWLDGNLCRCTGYQNVVAAVQQAAAASAT